MRFELSMISGGTRALKIPGDMIDIRAGAKRGGREIPEKIAERAKVEKGGRSSYKRKDKYR
ncbi:MAG: hypothetical protein SVE93_04430 [Candidatus Thermoplasmatota archaeon]|nr:hypothetical protein [Candidatus Thermoplasmatota archaeon]